MLQRGAVALEPVANYGRLSVAFLRFLSQMGAPGEGSPVSPGSLFQEVIRKAPRFKGMQQQDSHELFHYLIDGVNDEEMKRLKVTPKPLPVPDEDEDEGEGEGEHAAGEAENKQGDVGKVCCFFLFPQVMLGPPLTDTGGQQRREGPRCSLSACRRRYSCSHGYHKRSEA